MALKVTAVKLKTSAGHTKKTNYPSVQFLKISYSTAKPIRIFRFSFGRLQR